MRHQTVRWGLFFCCDSSPSTWRNITTEPLCFFWRCIKTCEFTASEMSRPQKQHRKCPQASMCLSSKWFRPNSGVLWPDLVSHQCVICMTSAAGLGTPGEPGQRQLCSVACRLSAQGQQQVWAVEVWGSHPEREHHSGRFIAEPAGVNPSSSATRGYSGGLFAKRSGPQETHSPCQAWESGTSQVLWAGWSHWWSTMGGWRQTHMALAEPHCFQLQLFDL